MVAQRVIGEAATLRSPASSGVGAARRDCLTEDEVLSLCEGRASSDALPRIDEHLDNCDTCQQWVAEMLGFADETSSRRDATLHPTMLRAGMLVAERFQIVRFIKRGGMGEVYEAFDQVLEAPVALKTIIATACDNPRAIKKLKAEVQLARSIRHPNVCSVFDFWEHRVDGDDRASVYFFTMELIEGDTLGQRLKAGPIELPEALRLARLQLWGLRAAHVSGVVHRDFKSDNVMLRSQRQGSEVVVMDFGLARLVPMAGGSWSNDSEQFAGSVAYMAPEQVEGRKNIGTEADVFSFGVVLFEMLTGVLPFTGDSPWTIATRRLTERPTAPSRLNPCVTPALDAFVLKCMSRHPSQRFKDASAALAALDELAALQQRGVHPPSHRLTSAALLVLGGIALMLFLTVAAWSTERADDVSQRTATPPPGDVSGAPPPEAANDQRSPPPMPRERGAATPPVPAAPPISASPSLPAVSSRTDRLPARAPRHGDGSSGAAAHPMAAPLAEPPSSDRAAASDSTSESRGARTRPPGAPARLRSRFE